MTKKLIVAILFILTLTVATLTPPVKAGSGQFGQGGAGASTSSWGGTYHVASRFLYSGGKSVITTMSMNTVATGSQRADVNLAVWEDNDGVPGAVVAYTDQIEFDAADNGWTAEIPCDNYNSINGTLEDGYYWVGARIAVGYQPWGIRRENTGGANCYASYTGTVSISSSFPNPTYSADRSLCILVSYEGGYIIVGADDDHSQIDPAGEVEVDENANQTFAFSADTGYHIETVTVDGVAQTVAASYTFHNVTADHNISITSALTPSAFEGFTLTPEHIYVVLGVVAYLVYRRWWR